MPRIAVNSTAPQPSRRARDRAAGQSSRSPTHGAVPACLVERRLERVDRRVREDRAVHTLLDRLALLECQLRRVREVEAELVRAHGRPRLDDVLAEHLAERRLQKVRGGVVGHRREPDGPRYDRAHAVGGRKALAAQDEHLVAVEAIRLDQLGANGRVVVSLDPALVGHLATARGIERRLAQLREEGSVAEVLERAELCEHVDLRVADELGRETRRLREIRGALPEPLLPGPA